MRVDRHVVGWSAGHHVDRPCGWQIWPWPAREVTESKTAGTMKASIEYSLATDNWENVNVQPKFSSSQGSELLPILHPQCDLPENSLVTQGQLSLGGNLRPRRECLAPPWLTLTKGFEFGGFVHLGKEREHKRERA